MSKAKNKGSTKKFSELIDSVDVNEVFLLKGVCEINKPWMLVEPKNTNIDIDRNVEFSKFDEVLLCEISVWVHGTEIDEKNENIDVFSIECKFGVTYFCENLSTFNDKVLQQFADSNALFNAYPFIREYVNSSMSKMLIPPYNLPLLKPSRKASTEISKE